ncbi:hypothetical protein [Halomarina oriensis]|uniref:DUF8054 domain-containing protein n=1 Tax=Halomarina oriensis TaxID=671145 RepID=A0A6B0GN70_9EURY|nr:hypothetical protein [Halomarina oriensis]MWG33018.1 hypothetical protein [Halomarina oriensis]
MSLGDGSVDIPHGRLVYSRVVDDVGVALATAFERSLTGYAVLTPQSALLLDDAECVLTFEAGVPVLAYDVASDVGGTDALTAFSAGGPCRTELYDLPADALTVAHDTPELRVPPGAPADHLADDAALADRCRARAPDDRTDDPETDPLEAFLADEERIAAIQEEARADAERRAAEWGLDDHLDG